MVNRWWSSLAELSPPEWRPRAGASQEIRFFHENGGIEPIPTPETLASLGNRFSAEGVRWWQVRGKKSARLLGEWNRNARETDPNQAEWNREQALKLQRLIELAVIQQQPIWVEGDAQAAGFPESQLVQANRPRMFAWLVVSRNQRSVLEVGLDADRNRVTGIDRERYLRAMHELRDELTRQITLSVLPVLQPSQKLGLPEQAVAHLRAGQSAETSIGTVIELASLLNAARSETIRRIEAKLSSMEGSRLDSLQANQLLAKSLHQLLDGHGFRLRCPECGEPAIMRCLAAGNSPTGSFVFDHYLPQGRTFHGGRSSIPKLSVVAKPARQTVG